MSNLNQKLNYLHATDTVDQFGGAVDMEHALQEGTLATIVTVDDDDNVIEGGDESVTEGDPVQDLPVTETSKAKGRKVSSDDPDDDDDDDVFVLDEDDDDNEYESGIEEDEDEDAEVDEDAEDEEEEAEEEDDDVAL